jgi:hypothetical protein
MTRATSSRLCAAGLLFLTIITIFNYLARHPAANAQTNKEPAAAPTPKVENYNFLIAAPYWSVENGFVSTIEMKNYHVEEPLTITPILYPLDGPEIILTPITLKPSESRLLNINEVLASYGKQFTVGAAVIKYGQLTEGVFGANLTVLNAPKSLIYNFQFRLPEETPKLEGLWWFYDKQTDGFIAVQNTSDKNVTVVPSLYVHEQRRQLQLIQLQPHQMKLIELRRELNKLKEDEVAGGINLQASESGAIIAGGGLVNPEIGFSAPLRMDDSDMQAMRGKHLGQTIHALGVMIGADDPMMSMGLPSSSRMNPIVNLRNVSGQTIQVSPVFRYQIGNLTKSFALKAIQLNSQQVQRIDLLPYWQSGQIPKRVSSGSLELTYGGRPGSLLAAVTSVDQTGSYVFDSKTDNKLAAGFHGEYWSTEGDNDTSITIKNITRKPATAWVSLQYDAGRGQYDFPALVLQPGESHMIDLKMLQKEGMAGASGELLPETATYGGFKLVEEPGGRHFLIDAVVFNPKTATCGVCGFGCLYPTSINMPGGTYIVALADSGDIIAVNAHMCDGTNQTGWACTTSFSSDDTGVTTVDPFCQSRGFGAGAGGTIVRTTAADVPGPHCGDQTLHSQRPATVKPKITSISPVRGLVGVKTAVTINGMGFKAGTTVSAGSNITVSNLTVVSSTKLTADFTVAAADSGGDHSVTATSGGQPSNSDKTFYVQIPYAFVPLSETTADLGCPAGNQGYGVSITYQVVDQEDPAQPIAVAGLTPEEFAHSSAGGMSGYAPFATPQTTDADGKFVDIPVGTCFSNNTQNFCGAVVQEFRLRVPQSGAADLIFSLGTQNNRIDAVLGQKSVVTTGTLSNTLTLGTVSPCTVVF